jgi:hypothetical protein
MKKIQQDPVELKAATPPPALSIHNHRSYSSSKEKFFIWHKAEIHKPSMLSISFINNTTLSFTNVNSTMTSRKITVLLSTSRTTSDRQCRSINSPKLQAVSIVNIQIQIPR